MIIEEEPPLFSGALLFLFIYNQSRSAHVKKTKHISSNEQIVLMLLHQMNQNQQQENAAATE
jgi:hypothetical protein